jgi:hypothetical protein
VVASIATAIAATTLPLNASASDIVVAEDASPAIAVAGDGLDVFFDVRSGLPALRPTIAQRDAVTRLRAEAGRSVQVNWNPTYGTPRMISAPRGYLSAPATGDPLAIARTWLVAHKTLLGLTESQIRSLEVIRNHTLPGVNARVLSFVQSFGGVAATHGSILTVTVAKDGRVLAYAGDPVKASALTADFDLTAAQALSKAVGLFAPTFTFTAIPTGDLQAGYQVFEAGPFAEVQRVKQVTFAMPGGARPAYSVLFIKSHDEAWDVIVDAATGDVLSRLSLVQHEAEGTVYENFPGAKKGGKPVVVPFGPTKSSPGGWVDPTGLAGLPGPTTFGNNANSFAQWAAPLAPTDQWNRPVSPLAAFNYAYEANWAASQGAMVPPGYALDRDPAVVNLFYHHNRIHDEYYEFGFTETGGNFQLVNADLGGQGGDPVFGLAHSGAISGGDPTYLGRDNANFMTLPDGIPGLTSMYLWEPIDDAFEGPYSDGDFDATVIQHEYSHGLSNRYVGGGGLSSLGTEQSGAMGEGWGDWYALNHLWREGLYNKANVGEYATGNTVRGIRNWSYDKHPTTYGDYGYDISGPEVHSDGEIWTATLWQLRREFTKRYSQAKASDVAEHLVTDAMPLSPASPSFLDMRDAILQADTLRYKSGHTDVIWSVFADRGMGKSAKTATGADTDPEPGFDHPSKRFNADVTLKFVNASTGKAVKGARVLIGLFEARATAWNVSNDKGVVSDPVVKGRHTFTVQAPGYGIQRFTLSFPGGAKFSKTIALRPNLASEQNGAKIVKVTSEDAGLPASFLLDDTEASAWRTATAATTFNEGPAQSATVKLAKAAKISEIHVSAMKPTTAGRFNMVDGYSVSVSADGKSWKTVKSGRFAWQIPRPTIADMMMKTIKLDRPTQAAFVKVTIKSVVGNTKTYAVLAELQAFSPSVKGVTPKPIVKDKPVKEAGSILVGNISQATLLAGTVPYTDGVTTASWTCGSDPVAQGVDAWIMGLPSGFADGVHQVRYETQLQFIGESYLWFYDGECNPLTGDFALDGQNLLIPPGAAYVGLLYLYGAGFDFNLVAEQIG